MIFLSLFASRQKENEFNISSGFNSEISNGVNFCTIERYDISIERFTDPKKNEIELNNENNNQIINNSNDDYSTVTNDNLDSADTDDNDSVG